MAPLPNCFPTLDSAGGSCRPWLRLSASPALLLACTIELSYLQLDDLPAMDPGSVTELGKGCQEPVPGPELQLLQVFYQ